MLDLDAIEKRNLGCHQCEEGRPHTHSPDFRPYVLNKDVAELVRFARNMEEGALMWARNADYYRDLLDEIAANFGKESFTSDDGSVQDSPLRAKMPELVRKLAAENYQLKLALRDAARTPLQKPLQKLLELLR